MRIACSLPTQFVTVTLSRSFTSHFCLFVSIRLRFQGRPFVKRFALCCRTVDCPVCLSVLCCPVCDVGVLWPNGRMDQDATWYGGRPRSRPHCVTWGLSPQKGGREQPPIFWSMYCGQTAGWFEMPLGMEVGLGPGHIVLDGDPSSSKKGYSSPPPICFH